MLLDSERTPRTAPNLVRWGAVFAGTILGLAIFSLVSSLWLAIAYSDNDGSGWLTGNLPWFIAGTAIASLFLAGLLAGYLSGVRGAGAGLLNGLTSWGLVFIASLLTVVPGLASLTQSLGAGIADGTNRIGGTVGQSGAAFTAESAAWTTFWSLLIGAVVAAVGGVLGGKIKRDATVEDVDVQGAHAEVYPSSVNTDDVEVRRDPVVRERPLR